MGDDSSDVTKALAAFGAPAVRYHSFGHAPLRPSSVVPPRRVPAPPAEPPASPMIQHEPVAAPEPRPSPHAVPPRMTTPVPAPAAREAGRTSLFPPVPTTAPPPRPLAEWAAPITAPLFGHAEPSREAHPPAVGFTAFQSAPVTAAIGRAESPIVPPPRAQQHMARQATDEWSAPRASGVVANPPAAPPPTAAGASLATAPRVPASSSAPAHSIAPQAAVAVEARAGRTLAEVFALLAAGPAR